LGRPTVTERLDGLLGSGDLRDRAAGKARCSGHAALKSPFGLAVDIVLKRLGDTGSRRIRPWRTRRLTKTSAFPGVGISQRDPSNQTELGVTAGSVTARSTRARKRHGRQERPETEHDSEELGIGGDRGDGRRRLGAADGELRDVAPGGDDDVPAADRDRDERRLRLAAARPRLLSTKRESEPRPAPRSRDATR
jgi:hypothetical protein